jgi:hypothetical protein
MKATKKTQVTPERLMQFGFAYAPPLIIAAAVANKVFDSLESGSKAVDQISKETGASERGLRMLMNALVGLELLKKDRHQKYSLSPESAAFLVSTKPGTLAGFFQLNVTQLVSKWLQLGDVVRTGQPTQAVNQEGEGTEFFSGLVENIIPMSYATAQTLANHLKLAKAKNELRVLDLAAGSGIWGIVLAQASPRVRVTAVDWAGMRTQPLPPLMFAVQMLVNTEKGDTFTFNEIKSWLEKAGFKKVRRVEAPGPSPLILATKP